ncbi:MAG: BufA1 family periplasmic bufferin-type metallophore [Sulfuriferula sp.]
MNKHDILVQSAVASLLAFGSMAIAAPAVAADAAKMEQCYGIAKAGKNDCAGGKGSANTCAGTAKKDSQKDSFVLLPKGTCAKIVGGTTSRT